MQVTDIVTPSRRFSFPALREILLADTAILVTTGLVYLGASGWLGSTLELPSALLAGSGAFFLAFGAGMLTLGTRRSIPSVGVYGAIGVNVAWAVAGVVVLLSGLIDPNALGVAFVLANLVAALVVADLEFMGLRATG